MKQKSKKVLAAKQMTRWILFVIIFIAAILRLWNVGAMPPGITNDEGGAIYSALSAWKTGRSLDGVFLPLSFNLDNSFPPVNIYLTAPFIGIFGPNAWASRVPLAVGFF